MTSLKRMFLPALFLSFFVLYACKKDEKPNNILSKKGISLSPANENQNPAVVSSATGNMDITYDKTTHELKWDITYSGLTDSVTASHIHGTAPKTGNAGVKVPFTLPRTKEGAFIGSFIVDGVLIKEDSLLAGFYYLNIHTKRYGGGEIRGQIEF